MKSPVAASHHVPLLVDHETEVSKERERGCFIPGQGTGLDSVASSRPRMSSPGQLGQPNNLNY